MAFLGRSNVGKSSLLNALAGRKGLARVSSDPGRTRMINFFRVEQARQRGGGLDAMYFVDLPGYGYAKAPRGVREGWERLVMSYMTGREALRLCVFIVDARHPPTERDLLLRTLLEHQGHAYVVAANKIDKMGRDETRRSERAIAEVLGTSARALVPVSATRRTGVDELWNIIRLAAFDRRHEAKD